MEGIQGGKVMNLYHKTVHKLRLQWFTENIVRGDHKTQPVIL